MSYAGVIIDIAHSNLDKIFNYRIPDELREQVGIGTQVEIPFGNGNGRRRGYVVEITDEVSFDESRIKDVYGVVKDSISVDERMIKLAWWLRRNYGSTVYQALKTVMPVRSQVKQKVQKSIRLLIAPAEAEIISKECADKRRTAQARLLDALIEVNPADYGMLTDKLGISMSTVRSLENKGIIEVVESTDLRTELGLKENGTGTVELNEDQRAVCDDIIRDIDAGDNKTCLIKGVTGSGKTEVYMELIDHVLSMGKQAIVLIPEIALTYQTVMRFHNRFRDKVSIVNSRLSEGEKYDRFMMAREGKISVMIGPRSALFTPFPDPGLIIIDEEHENSYQSDQMPRYHARETAVQIGRMTGAKVILGSATPSMEAYYRALNGDYRLYRLDRRAGKAGLPDVEIIDLRDELRKGNKSMISDRLAELMHDRLERKEQIMLFLNRRGYQGFVTCRSCGKVIKCPHCDVSLTIHENKTLMCHYCGYEVPYTRKCPECGSGQIGTFKAGTEKVEEEVHKLFPDAGILRMDKDTTKGKEGHRQIIEKFIDGEADVLIGTQMIVKGHDFPNVTLMGVLLADGALHSADYRAAENNFELLTQAAGRAGRGDKPGNVVIQTYDPEHYSIVHAARQDFEGFYEDEISYRKIMDYPPVSHMMSVKVMSGDEEKVSDAADTVRKITGEKYDEIRLIGPAKAQIYKINDIFTKIVYYKCKDYEKLIQLKDVIEQYVRDNEEYFRNCQVQFDFR